MTAAEAMTIPSLVDESLLSDTSVADKQDNLVTQEPEAALGLPSTPCPSQGPNKALKVLFLSSDTGGGHRASAESLAGQFEILFPGSTYHLLDLATESYLPPYNSIVSYYKHLSAHPSQWKLLYGVTNSRFMEKAVDTNIKVMTVVCERSIRKKIKSYDPDVVVSVHPLQTSVPILSCAKISHETGKHLPMFTVVTDLGSAHSTWFANGVEKMFVGSKQIYSLARERGKVPEDKLVLVGLPIRNDFAVESEKLGDRWSLEGKNYQREVRARLQLPATDRKTLLVMGGGEGCGALSNIVDVLYCELAKQGIDAVIMVVCGRNEKLKKSLENRNWPAVFQKLTSKKNRRSTTTSRRSMFPPMFADLSVCGDDAVAPVGCLEAPSSFVSLRRILSSGSLMPSESPVFIPSPTNEPIEDEKKDEKPSIKSPEKKDSKRKPLEYKSMSIGAIQMHESLSADEVEGEASVPQIEKAADADSGLPGLTVETKTSTMGKVNVVGLGFVTNMAEFMVAADVLVSKAGPGTISEAAALSLPVMLTSFLPGQEEGNVDYVIEGGFGAYCHDSDPQAIAEELALWFKNESRLKKMSIAAKAKGAPYAARDIVQQIGDSTLKWRELNEANFTVQQQLKTLTASNSGEEPLSTTTSGESEAISSSNV